MPKVDSFEFGSIVVDGKRYGHDIFVFANGTVKPRKGGFWKFGSHVVKKGEIDELLKTNPDVILLGTGTSGRVRLAPAGELALKKAGVECVVLRSLEASERLNELLDNGKQVAALIHVTW